MSIFFLACSNIEKSKVDNLTMKIISPTNCIYNFDVTEDSLILKATNVLCDSKTGTNSDTSIQEQRVVFDIEAKKRALAFIKAMKEKQFKINTLQQTDAYQYEVYLRDSLIGRELCCDVEVNRFLRDCLPYIDIKKNACSGFFDMIAQTKD